MAKVQVKVAGGSIQEKEAYNISALMAQLSLDGEYQASVNGEPQDGEYVLEDYEFVTFSKKVKAGL